MYFFSFSSFPFFHCQNRWDRETESSSFSASFSGYICLFRVLNKNNRHMHASSFLPSSFPSEHMQPCMYTCHTYTYHSFPLRGFHALSCCCQSCHTGSLPPLCLPAFFTCLAAVVFCFPFHYRVVLFFLFSLPGFFTQTFCCFFTLFTTIFNYFLEIYFPSLLLA